MKRCAAVLLVLTIQAANAEPVTTLEEARKITDAAMQDIAQGRVKAGFDRLKPYTLAAPGAVELAATQSESGLRAPVMVERNGNSVGFELVREIKLGSSLARYVYLHKFEKSVLRWQFDWYRAADHWRIVYFNFDDKARDLFEN